MTRMITVPLGLGVIISLFVYSPATAFTTFHDFRPISYRCSGRQICDGHGPYLYSTKDSSIGLEQSSSSSSSSSSSGLYRRFLDHAWEKLEESGMFRPADLPSDLQNNQAPAKGIQDAIVRISTQAMIPTNEAEDLVRYARVALLETILESSSESVQSIGIQVLNFVVIPSESTSLPVLGIDLVSLPGNKHLLLLDAQPMTDPNPYEENWNEWHSMHVAKNPNVPWGGDFPEPVQQYVSKYALWTRLQEVDNPISIIENDVWQAFVTHLDLYLTLLKRCRSDGVNVRGTNHQPSYLEYRRSNDPAKPMLNSLYGSDWTERILDEVLFPR